MPKLALVAVALLTFGVLLLTPSTSRDALVTQETVIGSYGQLPLTFEANVGQTDDQVDFLGRGSGYSVFLTPREAVLVFSKPAPPPEDADQRLAASASPHDEGSEDSSRAVLRMQLVGSDIDPQATELDQLPGKVNYLIGNDPDKWRTNVPVFSKVKYVGLYPGVDLVYYGNQQRLEYDLIVGPGADPNDIVLALAGAENLAIDEQGDLNLDIGGGQVVFRSPAIYQELDGARQAVVGQYVLLSEDRVGFHIGSYDVNRPLIIDPVLEYATYVGGGGQDAAWDVAVDSSGNAYVVGQTSTANFPTLNPLQGTTSAGTPYSGAGLLGTTDAFVTKLDPTGENYIYWTYLGGGSGDIGLGIDLDSSGRAYIAGTTNSFDFPLVNPMQGAAADNFEGFVARLNAAGDNLDYSTYLGGLGLEDRLAIAVQADNAYVTGRTRSANFPTSAIPLQANNAYQPNNASVGPNFFDDVFVTRLDGNGAMVYSTYLGGEKNESGRSIAVDDLGNAYVTGETNTHHTDSPQFPLVNEYQPKLNGGTDAFVSKFDNTGALVYSTYLGGSAGEFGYGIAVDGPDGNFYVTGATSSGSDFPVANAYQPSYGGGTDAFVTKFHSSGSALEYSTFLGGGQVDIGWDIAVNTSFHAYVTGQTGVNATPVFPTVFPIQANHGGGPTDGFVAKFTVAGDDLVYSTYLGGGDDDILTGIAVDTINNAYVAGQSWSSDYPQATPLITMPVQSAFGGGNGDAVVSKILDPTPTPTPPPTPIVSLVADCSTPPDIDGNIGSAEWAGAAQKAVTFATPTGATFSGRLAVMRDLGRLYLAIKVEDPNFEPGDFLAVLFDNDHSGLLDAREDVLIATVLPTVFFDGHWDPNTFEFDLDAPYTPSGKAAAGQPGADIHFEFEHPLDSGQAEDISAHTGDTLGFILVYEDASTAGNPNGGYPVSVGDGQFDMNAINANAVALYQIAGDLVIGSANCPPVPTPTPTPSISVTLAPAPQFPQFDCAKSLYVTNEGNGAGGTSIVRVDCMGIITPYAEGFDGPSGAVFDEATGNLIISDDNPGIHSVDAAGNVTPVAANFAFANPNGLAVDSLGRLLVADSGSSVFRVTLDSNLDAVLPVEPLALGFRIPQGVVVTPAGDVLFTDVEGYIYRIEPTTTIPIPYPGIAQRLAVGQVVNGNQGSIKLDAAGNIYTSDFGHRIVRISPNGQTVKDVVNLPLATCPLDQSADTVPAFRGLVFDPEDDLVVTGYCYDNIYIFQKADLESAWTNNTPITVLPAPFVENLGGALDWGPPDHPNGLDGPFGIAFFDTLATGLALPADISVSIAPPPVLVVPGTGVTISIAINNHGPAQAMDPFLNFELLGSITLVSATSNQGTCESSAGTVECELLPLDIGATATVEIGLTAPTDPSGYRATVTTSSNEYNRTNNTFSGELSYDAAGDIEVTSFTVEPSESRSGGVDVLASIFCNSPCSSRTINVSVWLDRESPPACDDAVEADLTFEGVVVQAGEETTVNRSFSYQPGRHTAWLMVDSNCSVPESDRTNNVLSAEYSLVSRLATPAFFGEVIAVDPDTLLVAIEQGEVRVRIVPTTAVVNPEGGGLAVGQRVAVVANEAPIIGPEVPDEDMAVAEEVTVIQEAPVRSHSQCAVAERDEEGEATAACTDGLTAPLSPEQAAALEVGANVVLLVQPEQAARLVGHGQALQQRMDDRIAQAELAGDDEAVERMGLIRNNMQQTFDSVFQQIRDAAPPRFQSLFDEFLAGRGISIEEALEEALTVTEEERAALVVTMSGLIDSIPQQAEAIITQMIEAAPESLRELLESVIRSQAQGVLDQIQSELRRALQLFEDDDLDGALAVMEPLLDLAEQLGPGQALQAEMQGIMDQTRAVQEAQRQALEGGGLTGGLEGGGLEGGGLESSGLEGGGLEGGGLEGGGLEGGGLERGGLERGGP